MDHATLDFASSIGLNDYGNETCDSLVSHGMVNSISNFPSRGQKDFCFLCPTNSSSLSIVVTQLLLIWISYPLPFWFCLLN